MKIVQLTSENVKRLKVVQLTPDGNTVIIGGDNAQGKSSVLDSIVMALNGKKSQGVRPVRDGEEKAKIVCDLGDIVVTRTITVTGGGTVTVKNSEGATYPSPQAMLDALTSRLTFDPLAFAGESAKKQAAMLKDLVGLDFAEQDAERTRLFEQRTNVNRRVKELEAQLKGMPHHPEAPEQESSVAELANKLEEARQHNRKINDAEKEKGAVKEWLNTALRVVDQHPVFNKSACDKIKGGISDALNAFDEVMLPPMVDTDLINQDIRNAETVNRQVRENFSRVEVQKNLNHAQAQAHDLPNLIVEASERGFRKVKDDPDASEFAVAIKLKGAVSENEKNYRMELGSEVACTVKSDLYKAKDMTVVPMDTMGNVIPPKDRVYTTTPFGPYLGKPEKQAA